MSNSIVNLQKSISLRKIKSDEDMKEYAETAMNELLGWYGYDKLNKVDSQALNLCLFSSESTPSTSSPTKQSINASEVTLYQPSESLSSLFSSSSSVSSDEVTAYLNSKIDSNLCENNDPMESTPQATKNDASVFSTELSHCAWCKKDGLVKSFLQKLTIGDQSFCSDQCLTQYHRANPKQNKICDWCRHVRHSVTYVDLQDGDRQYQFCSDKCLNQFKLDIFCQETKEHLEIHPFHHEQLDDIKNSPLSSSLITPDLWLRNCASPSSSEKSRSSTPIHMYAFSTNAEITLTKTNDPEEKPSAGDCYPGIESKKRKMQNSYNLNVFKVGNDVVRSKRMALQSKSGEYEHTTVSPSLQPNRSATLIPLHQPTEQRRLRRHRHRQRQHRHLVEPESVVKLPLCNKNASVSREYFNQSATNNSAPIRSLSNLQIPPLLPISRSSHNFQRSKDSKGSFNEPSHTCTKNSPPSETASSFFKALLPPATILVPYPVVLPIPIPIPIPLPIPIPVSASDGSRSQNNNSCDDSRTSKDISFPDNKEQSNATIPKFYNKNDSSEKEHQPGHDNVPKNTHSSSSSDISVSMMSYSRNMLFTKKKENRKKVDVHAQSL